jgi:hypothetical protein
LRIKIFAKMVRFHSNIDVFAAVFLVWFPARLKTIHVWLLALRWLVGCEFTPQILLMLNLWGSNFFRFRDQMKVKNWWFLTYTQVFFSRILCLTHSIKRDGWRVLTLSRLELHEAHFLRSSVFKIFFSGFSRFCSLSLFLSVLEVYCAIQLYFVHFATFMFMFFEFFSDFFAFLYWVFLLLKDVFSFTISFCQSIFKFSSEPENV